MSVVATIRNYPTNYTSNMELHFNTLEEAIRRVKKMDTIFVALRKDTAWHKVPLEADGSVAIGQYGYGAPRGGRTYYSEEFDSIVNRINEENAKPNLG